MKLKCEIITDTQQKEGVYIYAKEGDEDAEKIRAFVESLSRHKLIGYSERGARVLGPSEVYCFVVEEGKVYALIGNERYQIKERLYKIEETLEGGDFIKINQSCIVNIKVIEGFDASLGGALRVKLKNGYRDYISRRQIKAVKERLGLKI